MIFHHRGVAALAAVLISTYVAAEAPVQVEPVSSRTIVQQVDASGTVTSPRTATLSTAVSGIVSELLVDEGQRVETGDTLLKLDAELARLALERAQAEIRQREAEVADAKRRLEEVQKVGPARGIPQTEIDSRQAEVLGDEAALVAAQVAAREQQALVARHTLKAPFSGVVSTRSVELGEWVNPGDDLLGLVATNNLRFDFQVGQNLFSTLTPDTSIEITLDSLPGKVIAGRVDTIVPVKQPGARTFLVRALANSPDTAGVSHGITPGMSVRGRLGLNTGRSNIVVSRDAILRYPDGRVTVWVVLTEDEVPVVRERSVRTGDEFDGVVEVTDGLSMDDVVVTRGNETLQENQVVTIVGGD